MLIFRLREIFRGGGSLINQPQLQKKFPRVAKKNSKRVCKTDLRLHTSTMPKHVPPWMCLRKVTWTNGPTEPNTWRAVHQRGKQICSNARYCDSSFAPASPNLYCHKLMTPKVIILFWNFVSVILSNKIYWRSLWCCIAASLILMWMIFAPSREQVHIHYQERHFWVDDFHFCQVGHRHRSSWFL